MNNAFEQAVQLLARREHSYLELKQKLAHKGFDGNEIEQTVTRCQQQGFQCDERFTEQYCRYRAAQGDGPLKIRYALQQKGIANDLIQKHLEYYDWQALALEVYEKKYANLDSVSRDIKNHQKQIRFMQSRGFNTELIKACFASLEDN